MTEPPYGNQPPPPYGNQPPGPYREPVQYPHQELLPQHVQPGRSRLPLIISAVAVVVALVAALAVWLVVHDTGEGSRAAYCQELKRLTSADGLSGLADVAGSPGTVVPRAIRDLAGLAPGSVKSQWSDLIDLVQTATGGSPGVAQIARALTDLQAIVSDANSGCGMDIQFPG